MFRIKICGVTNVADALAAARAGADALGLNFHPPSPRYVTPDQAQAIGAAVRGLPAPPCLVGVFVNAGGATMRALAAAVRLDHVQLHGDEGPAALDELADLRPLTVVKAFRLRPQGWNEIAQWLDAARQQAGPRLGAALVDAHRPGAYGGTGETVDWDELAAHREVFAGLPLILAGGLRAENVAEAIAAVRPNGVDTASGVESSPGVKDHSRLTRFVAAAREAFDAGQGK